MVRHAGTPVLRAGVVAGLILLAVSGPQSARGAAPPGTPAAPEFDAARLDRIDALVTDAIAAGLLPGAVVVVGRRSGSVYQKAF
jgi:hypothetical protein